MNIFFWRLNTLTNDVVVTIFPIFRLQLVNGDNMARIGFGERVEFELALGVELIPSFPQPRLFE